MYTIHMEVLDQFVVAVTAFLPDKTQLTYTRLFSLLKNVAINHGLVLNPNTVHIDFEMAAIQAVRAEFNVEASGCLFHYTQSLYRKIQAIGLQVQYNTSAPIGIRRLMALPLLPQQFFQAVYAGIENQTPPNQPQTFIDTFHRYIWNTYVKPLNPLFPSQNWNAFGMPDRTTNICEGYHGALNESIGRFSPTIFRVIQFLQDHEAFQQRELAQRLNGAPPNRRKKKYQILNETINRLQDTYFNQQQQPPAPADLLQYLDAVAYQLWDIKY